jgi:mannosylglycerate hydrolase
MPSKDEKFTMHVVSHTHWDREWRYPFQEFRMFLIDMFDELIKELDRNPDYKYFLLDSQTIPLEDYLAMKPEKEQDLRRHVEAGRIHIGPWYCLPDTPEISGESIVRNLLMGKKITEEWKGQKWSGYSPFSFGHSSQMPQIYLGFGLDHMFFYRGNNNRVTKHEFIWEGPDGSQIMGMRSVNPYGRANWYVHVYRSVGLNKRPFQWDYHWSEGQLPFHPCDEELHGFDYLLLDGKHTQKLYLENLPKALEEIKSHAVKDATCNHLLYLDGMDQVNAYPRTPEIVDYANELNTGDKYIHSSFDDYVQAVKKNAKNLEVKKGEFRYTMVEGMWQNLFPGMLCARMYLKQQNRQCENKLQKNADTWAALAEIMGMEYPKGMMIQAWKYHLANQSHDSIAGCSVDLVHEDVEYRNRQVRYLADNVSRLSLGYLIQNINNSKFPENAVCMIAFNPTQYQRTEVVNAVLDIPEESNASWFTVEDDNGKEMPVQFIKNYKFGPIVKNPYEFPIPYKAKRFHCAIQVENIPGLGYKSFQIKPQPDQRINIGTLSPKANVLENEYLRAEILPDGRINLLNKENGVSYEGLHYFRDHSDVGDHATQRPADDDEIFTSIGAHTEISKTLDGPLLVQYKITITMRLPREALADRSRRSSDKVEYKIISFITLKKGSRYLAVRTEVNNNVRDHKLCVLFPTGYKGIEKSYSETHFDVPERDIRLPDTSTWKEPMLPYYPQYMFCGIEDENTGLAILNVGLVEYAAHDDEDRTIGLTLLRTYRFPIIGANPEDVSTDETQTMCHCLRPMTFEYAIYPYAGDWNQGNVFQHANQFNLKLRLNQAGRSQGELPTQMSFIKIEPNQLVLSAVKKSARMDSLVVRIFNPTEETVNGSIKFWKKIKNANLVDLNESPVSKADFKGDSVKISATKNKIVTMEIDFEK